MKASEYFRRLAIVAEKAEELGVSPKMPSRVLLLLEVLDSFFTMRLIRRRQETMTSEPPPDAFN